MTTDFVSSTLEEMCELVVDCPHFTPEWTESGFVVVRNQNIRNGQLNLDDRRYTHEKDFRRRTNRAKPRAGDIIFTREAPMGEVCLIPEDLECCLGQRQVLLRPRPELSGEYLLYALQSPYVQHQISWNEGTGSTVSNVRIPVLKALDIPRRSNEESIAALLRALDDKIDLSRRMNETLEAMARAIFKDWFVDFGPTRAKAEGRAPYLASELWELFPDGIDDEGIPTLWRFRTVRECFHLTMGQSPPGSTYNGDGEGLPFFQGRTDFGFRYPRKRRYCTAPTRIANCDDTLVSVRAPVGDINMAWEECCVGRGVAALRHKSGARSFTFYSAWAIQQDLKQYEQTGTVFGAINKKQFEALKVLEPTTKLVKKFESHVRPLDDRIRKNVAEIDTLAQTRDLLLPKLMSGEIRLRDTEKALEAVA